MFGFRHNSKIFFEKSPFLDIHFTDINNLKIEEHFNKYKLLQYEYFFVSPEKRQCLLDNGHSKFKIFVNNSKEVNLNIYLKLNKKNLKNKDFTLISDDCWGGYIYTYLNLNYQSPTIWLYINQDDYYKFCCNLKYYMDAKLKFVETKLKYPVGLLDDIKIYFNHYTSEADARYKWYMRKERINYNNLFFKTTVDTEDRIKYFNQIPYENKICFMSSDIIQKTCNSKVILMNDDITWSGFWQVAQLQCYKYFDIIEWFNSGRIMKPSMSM